MHSTSSERETSRPVGFRAFQNQVTRLMQFNYQDPLGEFCTQGTSGFNPQFSPNIPTFSRQVPLNRRSPLDWQNMQIIDETTPKYYNSPRPVTPDTPWYSSSSQDTSTACESDAEQEQMNHRRKTRRRKSQRQRRISAPKSPQASEPQDNYNIPRRKRVQPRVQPRQYDNRPLYMPNYHLPYPLQPTRPMLAPLPHKYLLCPSSFIPGQGKKQDTTRSQC